MKKLIFSIYLLFNIFIVSANVGGWNWNVNLNGTNYSAGTNLGTFQPNNLVLKGGWGNSWQNNGDDVCHILLEYTVSGGVSGSQIIYYVSAVSGGNPGDKYHSKEDYTDNISNLADGTYTLTVNYKLYGRYGGVSCGTSGTTNEFTTGILNTQTFTFTLATPMSVDLVGFYAQVEGNKHVLAWSTTSEQNNDYFEIQTGSDGANFIPLGIVKGNGTSTKTNTYSYAHHSDKAYAYYRLKQVDFDGTVSYSNMIFIKNADYTKSIDIFPNPTLGKLTITGVELESDCSVSVFDLAGKMVKKLVLDQDGQTDLSDLHSGLYIIAIIAKNETKNFKLLKG
ncbi:MAG TPA: T9SS type A sorting domain-containing protein [Saprospiraceae bacterium]|jgi:hypothetical protein|nr:T9SS type A sorting domain-containing protein [Saprospiraceae bacterium]